MTIESFNATMNPGDGAPGAPGGPGNPPTAGMPATQPWRTVAHKPENAFKPAMSDFIFALVAFVLGYLFSRWVFFSWQGWGVAAFTAAYLLTATAYLMKKQIFANSAAAWFWLIVTLVAGVSYALWENRGFAPIRAMFLFCAAVYYVIVASGHMIMGKTGNYLLIDGINAVVIIPFRNFFNQYVSFSALRRGKKNGKILPAILGVVIALVLAAILLPMLEQADSGGFGILLTFLRDLFWFDFAGVVWYALFAIPVAAYLYGLISGSAHGKGTDIVKPESAKKTVAVMRILQSSTVFIVLGAVCAIYLIFILSQLPYFFSAFTGKRPEGWLIFSEYARQGFFELCGIAAINLVILTVGNVTSRKHRAESRPLKAFNITLTVITLVLIATAFSKMALYIDVYGLTMRRLLPCVFMVFLAAVFAALLALQKWDFSIVRFALVTGAVLLCALCLSNPDALVVRYNADRYLSGTLSEFDTEILYRAGSAGAGPAIEVYRTTQDEALKKELAAYLGNQAIWKREAHQISVETYQLRERILSEGFFVNDMRLTSR